VSSGNASSNVGVGGIELGKRERLEEFVRDKGFLGPIRNFLDKRVVTVITLVV
jgi:hypothetical protein